MPNLDRFSQQMSWEYAEPQAHEIGETCPWCGSELIEIEYPESEIMVMGGAVYAYGGGTETCCPRGCC
jgi:hypothetical protein